MEDLLVLGGILFQECTLCPVWSGLSFLLRMDYFSWGNVIGDGCVCLLEGLVVTLPVTCMLWCRPLHKLAGDCCSTSAHLSLHLCWSSFPLWLRAALSTPARPFFFHSSLLISHILKLSQIFILSSSTALGLALNLCLSCLSGTCWFSFLLLQCGLPTLVLD